MSEADDAPDMAQPAPNPDAQTTVNDFLDYTEFFPSDLVRSLTLIADLDSTYADAVQQVHDLTVQYGKLPTLPEQDRPDPVLLRKQIAHHLQKAINQREFAYTEASRLYEVTVRHCQRSSVIKRKLQAQPQPPSRDPTPPPVSPSALRPVYRNYERPAHMRLAFDNARNNTSRQRDRHRKTNASHSRGRGRGRGASDSSDDSDNASAIHVVSPRKRKQDRDRHSRPGGGRARAAGVLGTNVHSSIAGISTSNALAQLVPPPADAKPGSKWAPWKKLTEYEMAVLRKQMKKNAVWTPSQTMMIRELEKKHRTEADYEREKARCEATGEPFLDEEPETLQQIMAAGMGTAHSQASQPANPPAPTEPVEEEAKDETGPVSIRLKPIASEDGRRLDRTSQRQKAMQDAQELIGASEKIKEAADGLKELNFSSSVASPESQKRRSIPRLAAKRKRDTSPPFATEDDNTESMREASVGTENSATKPPDSKRARLHLITPAPNSASSPIPTPGSIISTPRDFSTSAVHSPLANAPVPPTEPIKLPDDGNAVQVPLATAGPSTPKADRAASKELSPELTPLGTSPALSERSLTALEASPSPVPASIQVTDRERVSVPAPAPAATTAASTRSRRESVVPKTHTPPGAPQLLKTSKTPTPVPEPAPETSAPPTLRPRSARGHLPAPKAQSEEPKPNEQGRITRETRRYSVFGQPASALTVNPSLPAPTRTSARRKPPPKGEVTAAEHGQKTVTNVKRAQGSKNKRKKRTEEEVEAADDIDPDEPKYCICDDVSYGAMISCDNNVSFPCSQLYYPS